VIYTACCWTPVIRFGATKSPVYPEDGDGVSCRNVVKSSNPESAVCGENWIKISLEFLWGLS